MFACCLAAARNTRRQLQRTSGETPQTSNLDASLFLAADHCLWRREPLELPDFLYILDSTLVSAYMAK